MASTVIFSQKETRPSLEEIDNKAFQTFQGRISEPFFKLKQATANRPQYLSMARHPLDIARRYQEFASAKATAKSKPLSCFGNDVNKAYQAFVNHDKSRLVHPTFERPQPF